MARLYSKPNDASKMARSCTKSKDKDAGNAAKRESVDRSSPVGRRAHSYTRSKGGQSDTEELISHMTDMSLSTGNKVKRREIPQLESSKAKLPLSESSLVEIEEIEGGRGSISHNGRATIGKKYLQDLPRVSDLPKEDSDDDQDQEEIAVAGQSEEDETEGFDSLDDFIVSDNDSISLYEGSESDESNYMEEKGEKEISPNYTTPLQACPDTESELQPDTRLQYRPRRRLIRGRRKSQSSSIQLYSSNNESGGVKSAEKFASANSSLPADMDNNKGSSSNNTICPADKKTNFNAKTESNQSLDYDSMFSPHLLPANLEDSKNQNKVPLTPTKKPRGKDSPEKKSQPPQELSQMALVTPPSSPSKPCLKSPSKSQKNRIPPTPHRPSIDTFWSQEVINEWNDTFSPRKMQTPNFHRRHFDIFSDSDEDENEDRQDLEDQDDIFNSVKVSIPEHLGTPDSETFDDKLPLYTSPIKTNASPSKKQSKAATSTKKALAAKKREFDARKQAIAAEFFEELDNMVTGGEILELTKPAGGVNIVWNNKLATTAGRATWKKETIAKNKESTEQRVLNSSSADLCPLNASIASVGSSATSSPATELAHTPNTSPKKRSSAGRSIRHIATIELAEKVIDSEDRLLNTMAHEYCHLANFMISEVLDQPHGLSFKQWAKKCKDALDSNPKYSGKVEVNTKHTYLINYKYMWCCETCGQEYGRHSRSIDPVKVRCGKCYDGMLLQVKPKPRGGGKK